MGHRRVWRHRGGTPSVLTIRERWAWEARAELRDEWSYISKERAAQPRAEPVQRWEVWRRASEWLPCVRVMGTQVVSLE